MTKEMVERISFEDQISRNKLKSFLLIVSIFLIFLILGFVISKFLDPGLFFIIMIFSIIFSLVYIWIGYYFSANIAIASVGAKEASPTLHRQLFHSLESMSLASGLPMPKVYVMESNQINAFASGRNPENAAICVTTGALDKLNKPELEGVIAHEMAHIANYDIRYITLVAVLVGMISIIAEIYLRSMFFSSRDENNKNAVIWLIIGIVVAILAPIIAQLVSLAISRKREYAADATAVKFTRYSPGLKSALEKIKKDHKITSQESNEDKKHYSKAMAPLFISDPFKSKIVGLFSTHPPIEDRIRRLEQM